MLLLARMSLLVAALFAVLYALIVIVGSLLGVGSFLVYGLLAIGLMAVQFLIGPKIVEWTMHVRYVSAKEEPDLYRMVTDLAKRAKLPLPRVGISPSPIPNAFAFGRWQSDGRVCVTKGIRDLLSPDELRAVLGHELSHIRHRDVAIITTISVIPTIAWYIAYGSLFSRDNRSGSAAVGMAAFGIYFLTNLLVLYASRIREYYADRGSVRLGEKPHHLASALYKLTYGSARLPKAELKHAEGVKAFFASNPSRAAREFSELRSLDADLSGTIDPAELSALRDRRLRLTGSDRLLELFSTHPNMVKRIATLSGYAT
ncbi:MAG: M48 family metalloprotease [Candidatus Aenigmarchaeota archaeon]|nr:M48 family metalloprotease [Candidatus Aenigmarchaeota archaeon]